MTVVTEEIKLLAVDDDVFNHAILNDLLSSLDCQVVSAFNGYDALEYLSGDPDIDIILLDLEMPVLDGFGTISRLKENPYWRDIPVIIVTADSDEINRFLELGASDFVAKPYSPKELQLRIMNHVRTKKLTDYAKKTNQVLENEVIKKTSELRKALRLSQEAEYEISIRLGKAAEFRDRETGLHTRRISEMSRLLGNLSGLDDDQCEVLYKASSLHDVGKIGIPDSILLKPDKLDFFEFEIMKQHTSIGGMILSDSERFSTMNAGSIIALQHHEKWDGSGYPLGLQGEAIDEFARIVSIVDVFDALLSERIYKKLYPLEKAVRIMKEGDGVCFDPRILPIFLQNIDLFVDILKEFEDASNQ